LVCDSTTASFRLFSPSRPGSSRTPGSSAAAGSIPPGLSSTLRQLPFSGGGSPSRGGRSPPPRATLRGVGAIPRVGSSDRASSPLFTHYEGRSPLFLTTIDDTPVMVTGQCFLSVISRRTSSSLRACWKARRSRIFRSSHGTGFPGLGRWARTATNRRPACGQGGDVPSRGCRSRASRTICGWRCGFRPQIPSRSPPRRRA
jgi:hypothetical protein